MTEAPPRIRDAVPLPAGMTITDDGAALVIVRRWLRAKHLVLLAIIAALDAGLAYLWLTDGFGPWVLIGAVFLTFWNLQLVSMFVNSTTLRVTGDRVDVRQGPLPSLIYRNQSLAAAELKQVFAARWSSLYEVGAELKDGRRVPLMRPLVFEAQAIFVEQQIERRLGIVDFAVEGEVVLPPGVPAAVSAGGAGALALLPITLIGLGVGLFALMASSTIEGTLEASGERFGRFTFAADDCTSGQTQGFFGVELRSKQAPGLAVRAIRDPVRGTLVVVARGSAQPIVLTPEDCATLEVQITKTNTNINDVWVVEGRARIDCPELKGTVTFDGCH